MLNNVLLLELDNTIPFWVLFLSVLFVIRFQFEPDVRLIPLYFVL